MVFHFTTFSLFLGFRGDSDAFFFRLNRAMKVVFPRNVVLTSSKNSFLSPVFVAGSLGCQIVGALSISTYRVGVGGGATGCINICLKADQSLENS